jgi:hypothetical protein
MSHPTRTMRAINPAPDEQETAPTRQMRGINPAPDDSFPVIVNGQTVGYVTAEGNAWYARSLKGKRLGPFVQGNVAARALEQSLNSPTHRKLKARLLR